jgi:amino acid adenylation domain-containing protein
MTSGNIQAIFALTPAQEGMLFHTLQAPGSGVYVNQFTAELTGLGEVAVFQQAWDDLVAAEGALRTLFTWEKRSRPLQLVRERASLPWLIEDWRHLDPTGRDQALDTYLRQDRARGFELTQAPLMRQALFQTGNDTWRWVWTSHHLILDGWSSTAVLKRALTRWAELRAGHRAPSPTGLAFQEYVSWIQAQALGPTEAFWRRELAGWTAPTKLDLGLRPGPAQDRQGQLSTWLASDLTAQIQAFGRANRVTVNTLVQAAWALLLSGYTASQDVLFGVTVAGRPFALPAVDQRVGMFINTLPLRVRVPEQAQVGEWLRELQNRNLGLREHEHTPLAKVRGWSGVRGTQPLFDTIVVFENYPAEGELVPAGSGLHVADVRQLEQSNFPLALLVVPGERLRLYAIWDQEVHAREAIARVLHQIETLLGALTRDAQQLVSAVSALSTDEQQRIMAFERGASVPYPRGVGVQTLIARWAQETPEAPALFAEGDDGDQVLSHAELNRRANQLAHRLRATGVSAGTLVGLYLERGPGMLVGILGILKAGGGYVPLDPAYPPERLAFMLADSAIGCVVTEGPAPAGFSGECVDLRTVSEQADDEPVSVISEDDPAYLIYTSGSTGRPKGVPVSHRQLIHSTTARFSVYPGRAERFLLLSPFAFDSSIAGLFWPLCQGGTLCLPAPRREHDAHGLLALIHRWAVTHTLCLPSMYALITEFAQASQLASLQTVIVAGESCPPDLIAQHRRRAPGATLYNEYGPTEATVWASVYAVPADDAQGWTADRVPIGRPIPNACLRVVDPLGGRVPIGVAGELWVGGDGVVAGYRNRPDLNAERFTVVDGERFYRTGDLARWRDDGQLDYLGRRDHQVKIRGHRIELEEIESVLRTHPAVRDAVVVARAVDSEHAALDRLAQALSALAPADADQLLAQAEALTEEEIEWLV